MENLSKEQKTNQEYDLISEEIGNKDPESIKRIAKAIAEKIQIAIFQTSYKIREPT